MDKKTLALTITHVLAVGAAIASAVAAIGADKIAGLFSKNPADVAGAVVAIVVAVGAAIGAANSDKLVK